MALTPDFWAYTEPMDNVHKNKKLKIRPDLFMLK